MEMLFHAYLMLIQVSKQLVVLLCVPSSPLIRSLTRLGPLAQMTLPCTCTSTVKQCCQRSAWSLALTASPCPLTLRRYSGAHLHRAGEGVI